jgi:transcriptional regulator with XRE-family HTH domain
MTTSTAAADEGHGRVLGDELRRVRKARGWTRKELRKHLYDCVSVQAIATYELGTRQFSLQRLFELCTALDELPHDIVRRVYERLNSDVPTPGRVMVNLDSVMRDRGTDLRPLRRWAREYLDHANNSAPHVVSLDAIALERLAELCDLPTSDLIAELHAMNGGDPLPAHGAGPRAAQ